ncbi:hypothetical protein Emed_001119 [Eimeria media]
MVTIYSNHTRRRFVKIPRRLCPGVSRPCRSDSQRLVSSWHWLIRVRLRWWWRGADMEIEYSYATAPRHMESEAAVREDLSCRWRAFVAEEGHEYPVLAGSTPVPRPRQRSSGGEPLRQRRRIAPPSIVVYRAPGDREENAGVETFDEPQPVEEDGDSIGPRLESPGINDVVEAVLLVLLCVILRWFSARLFAVVLHASSVNVC